MNYNQEIEKILDDVKEPAVGLDALTPSSSSSWALFSITATVISLLGVVTLLQSALIPLMGIQLTAAGPHRLSSEHIAFFISILLSITGFVFLVHRLLTSLSASELRLRSVHANYIALVHQSSPLFQTLRSHSFVLNNLARLTSLAHEVLDTVDQTSDEFRDGLLIAILNDVKSVFDRVTDDNCAVCIKLVENGGSSPTEPKLKVYTLLRDERSASNRTYADGATSDTNYYDAMSNTAFREICDQSNGRDYFLCNDLRKRASEGKYQNSNPNWSQHYNACLVVPFGTDLSSLLGFVCVDNSRGNFDLDVGLPTLTVYSNVIRSIFLSNKIASDLQHATK